MDRTAFSNLFNVKVEEALSAAGIDATRRQGLSLVYELHGGGVPGRLVPFDQLIERLYLGEDRFYVFIDICVKALEANVARIFVRISAHPPEPFERTQNTPSGSGPFKVLRPAEPL